MSKNMLEAMVDASAELEQDTVTVTLPRLEAQGLRDLLEGGLAPKPTSPLAIKKGPPVMVALRSVFPGVFVALEHALEKASDESPSSDA